MPNNHYIKLHAEADVPWQAISTTDELTNTDYPIVSLELLELGLAANHPKSLGVTLNAGDSLDALVNHLDRIGLILLNFASYRDGRPYSTARILRDRHGFKGEIRATGDILVDQLHFMVRSGIDGLELHSSVDPKVAETALKRWSDVYQTASDDRSPVWQQRHVKA
jgi:uncharacterized protein (DUF934 family)